MHIPQDVGSRVGLEALADRETSEPNGTTAPDNATKEANSPTPDVPGYEILGELGRGTMGVVYKARQLGLDRLVALKMVLAGSHAGHEALHRFLSEARVVASLQHPNIVQLYEIGHYQERPYFSMELVEGGTLADRLGGWPQPVRQAAQFVLTLARTIHVAHQNGIVHRDLKPANILLTRHEAHNSHVERMAKEMGLHPAEFGLGIPKITDFGLAKQLHADAGGTESGMVMGTPSYMAPEQAEGKSSEVGPAADIYALGAIFYEMLTGRPPFTAESPMETVLMLFQTEPVPPSRLQPKIPRGLEIICLKCLQKEPQRRFTSAEELADDLRRFLSGEPILAKPASLPEKAWKWMRRRPALATLAASCVLAVVSVMGLILWHQVDLQARLGLALDDEREARKTQEEVSQRERLGQMRAKLKELLHAGEGALAAKDWNNAQLQLTRARDQVTDEPELVDLQSRIEHLLRQTTQQRQDHERLEKFFLRRNDALFHATLFTGGDMASALQETRVAAQEALALFGVTLDDTVGLAIDSSYYTEPQKAEIMAACYELLVVLAEAVALPLPGHTFPDQRCQAEEALRILDRAARLGVTTQAYHRRRAHYLAQAGQTDAVLLERQRANTLRPSSPLDHFLLGQEQYHQGDSKQAISAFENVLQIQPGHFWASYYLGLCWLKNQRPDQAITCLTSCLGQNRDFSWLYLLRASAWSELGQFDRAEADFDVALKAHLPDIARYGLLINRGVLRIRQGQLDSAMADLQQAIVLRPQQYQGYVNLAQAHLKAKQLDEAIQQLDQAICREPGLASLYRTRARVHLIRQDQVAALADLDRACELAAGAPSSAVADDHSERARLLHRQGKYTRALEAHDAALRLRPRDARIYRLRAEVLLELNRLPEALQSLDDCVRFGPPEAGVFRARAALRTRLGQCAGALTDFTRALEIEPDAATHTSRGWCFLLADAPKLALPDFEEAIRLVPEQGDAYAGRGYVRVLLGEQRPAVADAEEALRRGPRSPRLFYNVARIYAQAVARLDREDPHVSSLGTASLRGDLQDRALKMLTQALDMQTPVERTHFWQNVIQTDKALNPIRRGPGFSQLAARYSPQGVSTASGKGVQTRP